MSDVPAYPAPAPTRDSARFWEAARAGRLELQYCPACERWQFYPRPFCTACLGEALEWRVASGRGVIHTLTTCHIPAHPAFAGRLPYTMALVDLPEGVRMLGEVLGEGARIGDAVRVEFEHRADGTSLPRWRLEEEGR